MLRRECAVPSGWQRDPRFGLEVWFLVILGSEAGNFRVSDIAMPVGSASLRNRGGGGKWVGSKEQGGNTGRRYLGGAHRVVVCLDSSVLPHGN